MGWQLPSSRLGFLLALLLLLCSMAATKGDASSVTLLDTPSNYTTNKTASFSFASPADCGCSNRSHLLICKLDDSVFSDCSIQTVTYFDLDNGLHKFEVCINGTLSKEIDCAFYNWTIDSVSPTASLTASKPSTTGMNVSIDISFSEPCGTGGSFQCSSVDSCNLLVQGPGEVIPSSLEVVEPYLKYKLLLRLEPTSSIMSGQVNMSMDEGFCADTAGNKFRRSGKSSLSITFDRTNQSSSFSTQIPVKLFTLNGQLRSSFQATNNVETLKFVIHFLQPVVNSSVQILSALNASKGRIVVPVDGGELDNQTFSFMVTSLSQIRRAVINVSLDSHSIITTQGTAVSPIPPFNFLYDTERPVVWLSTSKSRTREDNISISIHFEKPVVDLNSSNITISGGQLMSFRRINLVTYAVTVRAVGDMIYVNVPENVTEDLAGNKNLPSTFLKVWHAPKSAPTLSVAASSFATASFVGVSFASGLLTVSTAALQVNGASPSSGLTSLPSTNLFRMLSFLQVISLSRWLMDTPNEYYELAQRLQWSIPRYSFPWDHKPKPSDSGLSKNTITSTLIKVVSIPIPKGKPSSDEPASGNPFSIPTSMGETVMTCKAPSKNSKISVTYPDDEDENDDDKKSKISVTYPDDEERDKDHDKNNDDKDKDKDKGICSGGPEDSNKKSIWKKILKDNLPLAITTGGMLGVHFLLVLLLKSKRKGSTEKPINYGGLTFPRIEIFLVLEAITSLCEAFSSLIHEWKPLEVAVGIIGLIFVLLAVLALFVFLLVGVTFGKLLHYEEETHRKEGRQLCGLILGQGGKGQWTWKGRPDSIYLTMFGLLFEDLRGPLQPRLMHSETVTFKDAIWKLRWGLSSYYNFIDSLKRVCLGIMAGGQIKNWFCQSPAITMLCINSFQLLFIILVKPFTERRVQLVNIIAVGSEIGIYALGVPLQDEKFFKKNKSVFEKLMVSLVIAGVLPLIANEVYGMYNEVKKLDNPDGKGSFSKGFKIALYGLHSFFTSSPPPQIKADSTKDPVPKTSPKSSPLVGSSKGAIIKTEAASTPTQNQNREDGKSKSKDAEKPQTEAASTQIEKDASKGAKHIGYSDPSSKNLDAQSDQDMKDPLVAPMISDHEAASTVTRDTSQDSEAITNTEAASTQTQTGEDEKSTSTDLEKPQTEASPTQILKDASKYAKQIGSPPSSNNLEASI